MHPCCEWPRSLRQGGFLGSKRRESGKKSLRSGGFWSPQHISKASSAARRAGVVPQGSGHQQEELWLVHSCLSPPVMCLASEGQICATAPAAAGADVCPDLPAHYRPVLNASACAEPSNNFLAQGYLLFAWSSPATQMLGLYSGTPRA